MISKIVGLYGLQGVGKSHVGFNAAMEYDNVLCRSFAMPLRDRIEMLGLNTYEMDKNEPQKILGGRSIRQELQADGERLRELNPNVFIDCMVRDITDDIDWQTNCTYLDTVETMVHVIDDVRFENEAEFIQTAGALVHLVPVGELAEQLKANQNGADHISEQDWHHFTPDVEIEYDHTPESLAAAIKVIEQVAL